MDNFDCIYKKCILNVSFRAGKTRYVTTWAWTSASSSCLRPSADPAKVTTGPSTLPPSTCLRKDRSGEGREVSGEKLSRTTELQVRTFNSRLIRFTYIRNGRTFSLFTYYVQKRGRFFSVEKFRQMQLSLKKINEYSNNYHHEQLLSKKCTLVTHLTKWLIFK